MKVSDYILNYFVSQKIRHVFLITGSAIAFVVDAFHSRKDISYICVSHEQAGAMAAEAYSRMGPGFGAVLATSGPGATNLITGICCAWFDSIPMICITGQVNTYEQSGKSGARQVGFQETNIVAIAKPVTKFSAMVEKPEQIRFLLEKATYIAKSGRPGPVLLDLPQNLQRAEIDPNKLKSFKPPKNISPKDHGPKLIRKLKECVRLIENAKRPVILAGFGIRIAGVEKEIRRLVELLNFPVVTTWSGFDLFPNDHHLRVGASGVYGNRGANFAIQNSDLLISIGARLDTRQTGGKPATYAREAKKIVVDIDPAELAKRRGLTPDVAINCDAKEFLTEMIKQAPKIKKFDISEWMKRIKVWRVKYPACRPEYFKQKKYVNPYVFGKVLSEELPNNAVIIPDEGGNLTWSMQSLELKDGQRLFSAFGNSPMGYALPASIGVSFAVANKRPVICISGDGGIHINIQELQTVVYHKLPIKIFILNNKCYGIIKQFQEMYLESRFEASGKGYEPPPNFIKIAKAYGMRTVTINNHQELRKKIKQVLEAKEPVFCDVYLDPDQKIIPKLEFGKPIEDLTPYLSREEFLANMIVKPLAESHDIGVRV